MLKDQIVSLLSEKDYYTKELYIKLGSKKGLNMSLNKFRNYLHQLHKDNVICYDVSNQYPMWKGTKHDQFNQ